MSIISTAKGKAIVLISVFRRKTKSQKTSDSFDDFHIDKPT